MKKALLLPIAALLTSVSAQAKTIASDDKQIPVSSVSQVVQLAKVERDSVTKTVSVVVTDHGKSTDVSPTASIYLTFTAFAEMGNISTSFPIDHVLSFASAVRKSAGIYEIKAQVYRDEAGIQDITYTIDTNQMFIDEDKMRKACGGDFCDGELKTSIEVKETLKKAQF
ncbi:hypothetical protein Bb109J_c2465 [Bdellovibrio bacteriovorus]|uniref:hypothetical protein n=1 Tax=Bdellovibrio bacteriovorus TaxID=959 RepID=UPI00045BFD3A|nr:hypothetical protein [Bdellovibrio bacteriovorus]AHZ85155.1 hypothetical protein EP01_09420 [Bdellovibrio bacteriovorus]BEV69045.1 hypothetical protein Bb109J_c2465 [Bdellovibrio bacteriovorus]